MMDFGITFSPLVPWVLVAALGAVSVLAVGFAVFKGLRGWVLRGLAAAFLILALAGPTINQEERDGLSNVVFVVIDESESQRISDRHDQVNTALTAIKARFSGDADFELREVRVENDLGMRDSGSMVLTAL